MKIILSFATLFAVVVACASSGAGAGTGAASAPRRGSRASAACPAEIDSMFLGRGPVYRQCDVDAVAHLNPGLVHPDLQSVPADRCMSAEFEFVVGTDGIPEGDAVRLVRTTTTAFGDAVRRIIPALRYTPATKNGSPVRQLTRYSFTLNLVSSTGGAVTPPATTTRC